VSGVFPRLFGEAMAARRFEPIDPIDVANMRQNGVRSLDALCGECRYQVLGDWLACQSPHGTPPWQEAVFQNPGQGRRWSALLEPRADQGIGIRSPTLTAAACSCPLLKE
jgi:hypothetical protein